MRVNRISPIPLLTELTQLVLNILIIKQKKCVRLSLSGLQRSGIAQRCTGHRKKIRNNVKIRLDLTKERHALLLKPMILLKEITMLSFILWTLWSLENQMGG